MQFGLDLLGLAKFSKEAINAFPHDHALGAFSNVPGFGDALPKVQQLLQSGKVPAVRLHLYWSDRPGHKPDDDYLERIEKEAKRVGAFYGKFPDIERYVSGFCENPLNSRKAQEVLDVVMRHMPGGVSYVNSPLVKGGGSILPGVINEIHKGETVTPKGQYIFSYDGKSCFDQNVSADKKNHRNAEIFFWWYSGCNGRLKDTDTTPRKNRKAYPTPEYMRSMYYLENAQGITKLPKHWILKSHADRHKTPPEPRAGKPVIIAPDVGEKIVFRDSSTSAPEIIATAKKGERFREKYPVARYIYRLEPLRFGYQFSDEAELFGGGDPRVDVFADGKKVGVVNLAFRDGQFR